MNINPTNTIAIATKVSILLQVEEEGNNQTTKRKRGNLILERLLILRIILKRNLNLIQRFLRCIKINKILGLVMLLKLAQMKDISKKYIE